MKMIIEEDGVTEKEFLGELETMGVSLYSGMIEEILNLPESYLSQNDKGGEVIELQRKFC